MPCNLLKFAVVSLLVFVPLFNVLLLVAHVGNENELAVFINLHIVRRSPAELCTSIGAFMEFGDTFHIPCLVNLALYVYIVRKRTT